LAFFGAFQMALQMGAFYVCRVERKWGVEKSVWLASSLALIVIMYRAKAGLASYCSSFTSFQFVSGKKEAVFSSRKGEKLKSAGMEKKPCLLFSSSFSP